MPHVQYAGYIGGRNNNRVARFGGMLIGPKHPVFFPGIVPFAFNLGGLVTFGKLCFHELWILPEILLRTGASSLLSDKKKPD